MPRTALNLNNLVHHVARDGGDAGVPLVFVNSLGTDLRIWDDVVARLAAHAVLGRRPVVRYDLRGHGLSDAPPGPYAMDALADDLAGLLEKLVIDRAVLIGISVGGMIAMNLAAMHPERVAALVLCDTAPKIGTEAGWNDRIAALRTGGWEAMADAIVARWFAPRFVADRPAAVRTYRHMLTRAPVEGYAGVCAALRDADLADRLGRLTMPALVIAGDADVATPPEGCRALAEALPDGRFALIEAAGHLPCVEQPDAFSQALIRFFEDTPL